MVVVTRIETDTFDIKIIKVIDGNEKANNLEALQSVFDEITDLQKKFDCYMTIINESCIHCYERGSIYGKTLKYIFTLSPYETDQTDMEE